MRALDDHDVDHDDDDDDGALFYVQRLILERLRLLVPLQLNGEPLKPVRRRAGSINVTQLLQLLCSTDNTLQATLLTLPAVRVLT